MADIKRSSADSDFLSEAIFIRGADAQRRFMSEILPAYFQRRRWFAGKARHPERFEIEQIVPLVEARLLVVRVLYADGESERYLLPVQFADAALTENSIIARNQQRLLIDAVEDEQFRAELIELMAQSRVIRHDGSELHGIPGPMLGSIERPLESRVLAVEQSNTSIVYGGAIFLKLYRKLEEGMNPDAEITRFLSERQRFRHLPPFAGALELHSAGGQTRVLGLALGLVPNEGDAWAFTLSELKAFYARTQKTREPRRALGIGDYADAASRLGVRTGQLHLALAADTIDPLFSPEPLTIEDQRELAGAIRRSMTQTFALLDERRAEEHSRLIERLINAQKQIVERTLRLEKKEIRAAKIRTHGDYHLGQVLHTGDDFVIIDFEGEPLRPLAWRKLKRSPLRDIAGMLRSFDYAAHSALEQFDQGATNLAQLSSFGEKWTAIVCDLFVQSWRDTIRGASFVPDNDPDFKTLLDAFLLEKAIYEIGYELNNRPAWLPIPARGLLTILESE